MWEGLFQPLHLLIILGIAVFAFGPRKLPELGKGLGDGIRAFKEGLREATENRAADPGGSESGGGPARP